MNELEILAEKLKEAGVEATIDSPLFPYGPWYLDTDLVSIGYYRGKFYKLDLSFYGERPDKVYDNLEEAYAAVMEIYKS